MSGFVVSRPLPDLVLPVPRLPAAPQSSIRGPAPVIPSGKHPKMLIISENRRTFIVPYAPREVTMDGITPTFDTVTRAGRLPLLLQSSQQLRTMTFDLFLGAWNLQASVEAQMQSIRKLAEEGARLRVVLDVSAGQVLWRMTACSQQVTARQHGTNAATRAIVSITLTRASDPVVHVGPVSGGSKPPKPKPKPAPKRTYLVKRGDCLWNIARKYYGNGALYPRIAKANRIKNPHLIYPGQRFVIP